MASKVGEAFLEITAKNAKLKSSMKESEQAGKSFTKRMQAGLVKFGKVAFVGAIAGFTALTAAMIKATRAAAAEQVQTMQLAHQLGRLGLDAKRAMREVDALANAQQSMTRFGDTQTRAMLAQMIMLTDDYEGSMRNLKLAQDMAESGMFDQRSAARYLGMAMQGNIEMLGRYIPELKTSVNESLKHMSASEKAAYAVELLDKKFGGLAKTIGDTTAGAWAKMKNAISDAWEALGKGMLDETAKGLGNITTALKNMEPQLEKIGGAASRMITFAAEFASAWIDAIDIASRKFAEWVGLRDKEAWDMLALQKKQDKSLLDAYEKRLEREGKEQKTRNRALGEFEDWQERKKKAVEKFNIDFLKILGVTRQFEREELRRKGEEQKKLYKDMGEVRKLIDRNTRAALIKLNERYDEEDLQRERKAEEKRRKILQRRIAIEITGKLAKQPTKIAGIPDFKVDEIRFDKAEPVKSAARPRWMGAEQVWKQAMVAGIKDPVLKEAEKQTGQFDDMRSLLGLIRDNTANVFFE